MSKKAQRQSERRVMWAIHRLFWRGNFVNRYTFTIWAFTRPPASFIYNILIPIQVASGLQAIVDGRFDHVSRSVVYILICAVAYCVLWAVGGAAICKNGEVGAAYVQKQVFANFLQKDYDFYSNTYLGSLSAQAIRLRDSFNEYNQVMVNAVPLQAIVVVASVVVIGRSSLLVAAVTVGCIGLVLSYTIASSRWRLKYRRELTEASSRLGGVISDALGQAGTVKSFAAESYEQGRMQSAVGDWARAQYRSWMSSIPSDIGRMALAAGTTATLLLLTAHLYQQHKISLAVVALVQLYVLRLIIMTAAIADTIKSYESAMGGAYQSMVTMQTEATIVDPPKPQRIPRLQQPEVTLTDVTYRYPEAATHRFALKGMDVTIRAGEKIGLVGYSGSGKTTLTKLVLRFMDPTDGSIRINGVDIRETSQRDLRTHIAYVPQEPLLFHRSIAENISYGNPAASKKAVLAAAKAAYIDEFVSELPHGYDTIVGERGVKLSGGQRQRVAIARALLKDAPILVLDEATSALDSRSEQLVQRALWQLMKDRTALVVAHRLSTIQRMDRIVVMDKGVVVQIGTHEELLQNTKGIYAQLWVHQSGGYVGVASDKQGVASEVTSAV